MFWLRNEIFYFSNTLLSGGLYIYTLCLQAVKAQANFHICSHSPRPLSLINMWINTNMISSADLKSCSVKQRIQCEVAFGSYITPCNKIDKTTSGLQIW